MLGSLNVKGKNMDATNEAMKLFKKSILKILSLPVKNLMQIISKPMISAPKRHNNAIGLNVKSRDGLIKSKPPVSDINAADQRIKSMCSLKKYTANIIAKIGFRKLIAVASLTGIYKIDVNQIDIPNNPKHDLKA